MSAIRDHKRRIKESLDEIEGAIAVGIERKPVTIGSKGHCLNRRLNHS